MEVRRDGAEVNVNVNQEFLAWLKQPKLLQSTRSTECLYVVRRKRQTVQTGSL